MTDVSTSTAAASPDEWREQLVDALVADGTITQARVEAAMRTVPRHEFTPAATLEQAYALYEAVPTKWDEHGAGGGPDQEPRAGHDLLARPELN